MSTNSSSSSNALINADTADLQRALMTCANHIQKSMQKSNEIEKIINRPFIIELNDIRNLCRIVNERLNNDKDKITFNSFRIGVISTEENFRKFNTFDEFERDLETRSIHPIVLQIDWSLLIQFPDKEFPTKEEIGIVFTLPDYDQIEGEDVDNLLFVYKGKPIFGNGAIIINIENTNKIWALDILSHIETWISKNVKKPEIDSKNKFIYDNKKIIREAMRWIIETMPAFLFLGACIKWSLFSGKNEFNIKFFTSVLLISSILLFLNSIFGRLSIFFARKINSLISGLMPQSCFIFSQYDQKRYEEKEKKLAKKFSAVMTNILIPLLINIVSSFIFYFLFEKSFS